METFLHTVLGIVGVMFIALLAVGVGFLRQKIAESKAHTENTKWYAITNIIAEALDSALVSLEATIVSEIREKNEDGKITLDELDLIVSAVKEKAGLLISENVKLSVIEDVLGDWDEWFEIKVRGFVQSQLAARGIKITK